MSGIVILNIITYLLHGDVEWFNQLADPISNILNQPYVMRSLLDNPRLLEYLTSVNTDILDKISDLHDVLYYYTLHNTDILINNPRFSVFIDMYHDQLQSLSQYPTLLSRILSDSRIISLWSNVRYFPFIHAILSNTHAVKLLDDRIDIVDIIVESPWDYIRFLLDSYITTNITDDIIDVLVRTPDLFKRLSENTKVMRLYIQHPELFLGI
jgi:hypothetical protein